MESFYDVAKRLVKSIQEAGVYDAYTALWLPPFKGIPHTTLEVGALVLVIEEKRKA
jgi:hypothetical protein